MNIQTKFNIGDDVFHVDGIGERHGVDIKTINIEYISVHNGGYIEYHTERQDTRIRERDLFASLDEAMDRLKEIMLKSSKRREEAKRVDGGEK